MNSDTKDLLLVLGNNIDKRQLVEINQKIASDKDICMLLRHARGYYLKLLLLIVLSFLATLSGVFDAIGSIADAGSTAISLAGVFVLVISVYGAIDGVRSSIGDSVSLPLYLRCIFSREAPRHPSQLWQLIQGSVADAQLAAAAQRIWPGNVHTVFAGTPYYSIRVIDSLVIQWNDSGALARLATAQRYRKFLRDFSSRTMAAATGKRFFDTEKMSLEKSNSVFGILFFSAYLKQEAEARATSLNGKIRIALRMTEVDLKSGDESISECGWTYVKEFIEYCTTPESIQWVSCDENPDLVICGASFLAGKQKCVGQVGELSGALRIPVKRPISVANGGGAFPSCIDQSKLIRVVSIGGAEQSLALQHILNCCRWGTATGVQVGFAENAFEDYLGMDFLAGTEGLVYGVNDVVRGRDNESFASDEAEVFYAKIGQWDFYSVYGYSALLTKMSLCTFIDALASIDAVERGASRKQGTEDISDSFSLDSYIPGHALTRKSIIGYRLECDAPREKFYRSSEVKNWDNEDVINSTAKLLQWLDKKEIRLRGSMGGGE